MKVTHLIAAFAILAAGGPAFADITGTFEDHTNYMSAKTRAQLQDELTQARAQGLFSNTSNYELESIKPPMVESNIGARGPAGARESTRAESSQPMTNRRNPDYDFGP